MDTIEKNIIPHAKHILYQSARDIREIAAPLEHYLNITEFTYERIYRNNQKIKLSNQPGWLAYYYQNNFHLLGEQETINSLYPGITLTSTIASTGDYKDVFESCKKFFDIGDGLLLIEDFDEYRELYWFTSDASNKYLLNYHHNMELLKIFAHSFKEKAHKIIKNAEHQKILIPPPAGQVTTTNFCHHHRNENEADFLKSISTKKYRFYNEKQEIILSKKELHCAAGLLSGKSAKEISNDLCRSVRTIETHIDNIKEKLDCTSRSTLISTLLNMGVDIYRDKII
ncbi:MAG: helix-turn-helix transcriptional regulator [Gammaproteobacteria bacterium]|nr:helix-turn-helix transcriptional regulator [Gammaproteobacteria bacterium]